MTADVSTAKNSRIRADESATCDDRGRIVAAAVAVDWRKGANCTIEPPSGRLVFEGFAPLVARTRVTGYRANGRRHGYEHVDVAERALGRPLPEGAEIHHVNGNRADNRPGNLVICPSHAYHMLLHYRTRAFDACRHADWKRCRECGTYSPSIELRAIRVKSRHRIGAYDVRHVHPRCDDVARMERHRRQQQSVSP